jgi:SAM-dependent methyltransferase
MATTVADDPLQPYSTQENVTLYDKNVKGEDCNIYCADPVLWGRLLTSDVVRGSSVLVLPCGTGRNVWKLAGLGAARVLACDIAPENVEFCKVHEAEEVAAAVMAVAETRGDSTAAAAPVATTIEYSLVDAKVPTKVSPAEAGADIALAMHLFCFAESRPQLLAMCRCIALNIRPGGQVICYSVSRRFP